jgi:hypothetical protein
MNHDPCILQLLLALVSTYRYDGADSVDMELARSEAKAVHEAVRDGGGAGGHEELIRVVGTRSKAQLRATFGCFKDEHRRSVAKALPRGTDPTGYLRALRAAVRCVADPSKYFAKVSERGEAIDMNVIIESSLLMNSTVTVIAIAIVMCYIVAWKY